MLTPCSFPLLLLEHFLTWESFLMHIIYLIVFQTLEGLELLNCYSFDNSYYYPFISRFSLDLVNFILKPILLYGVN